MIYDLANFDNSDFLMQCCYHKNDINIADKFVIFSNRISTIVLTFYTKNFKEKIFLSRVCYCNRLDIKLIFRKCWIAKVYHLFLLVEYLRYKIKNY